MPLPLVICGYLLGVGFLFWLDREPEVRTSKALWIPVAWLLISGSRPVSLWLQPVTLAAQTPDQYMDGSSVNQVLLSALMLFAGLVLVSRHLYIRQLLTANAPLIVFFVYCAVSALWSDYPAVAFKRWIRAAGDVAMVLIVVSDRNRSAAFKRVLTRPAFVLIPLSILMIKYLPDYSRYYSPFDGKQFFSGAASDKNMLGVSCLIFGLSSVWQILSSRKIRNRDKVRHFVAHGVIVAMIAWLFWMANSVTSLTCFVLATGLMFAVRSKSIERKPRLVHALVGVLILATLISLFSSFGTDLVAGLGREPTLTGRTEIWGVVLSLVGNQFVGVGFESFWLGARLEKMWSLYWFHPNEAHNGYLEMFLNLGWVGITIFAILVFFSYRNILSALHHDPQRCPLRLAYFVVALIYNITEAAFKLMSPVWIVFLMVSVAVPVASCRIAAAHIPEPKSLVGSEAPVWDGC